MPTPTSAVSYRCTQLVHIPGGALPLFLTSATPMPSYRPTQLVHIPGWVPSTTPSIAMTTALRPSSTCALSRYISREGSLPRFSTSEPSHRLRPYPTLELKLSISQEGLCHSSIHQQRPSRTIIESRLCISRNVSFPCLPKSTRLRQLRPSPTVALSWCIS